MSQQPEDFCGNDKHYKMLHKAISNNDISIWNSFAASMGPAFRADLRGIQLGGLRLVGIRLTGARLDGACFDGADLTNADFTGATLTGVSFREAILVNAKLRSPARIKVQKVASPEAAPDDPEARRRQKIERMQQQAIALLADRKLKEEALARQQAKVRERNRPSPFTNLGD